MSNAMCRQAGIVSKPDGSTPCSTNAVVGELLAAATASFDSDRERAKACIRKAAELLQVSGDREGHEPNAFPTVRGGLATWQVERLAVFVAANICSHIRADDLARIVQLSTSHFFRAFKKSFGETPLGYVMRQRMYYARARMLSSRDPLVKIALDCGMCDQSHFSRVFRKIVGVNPHAWRRQFQKVRSHHPG
jgi:AraC family transcriptional regulator